MSLSRECWLYFFSLSLSFRLLTTRDRRVKVLTDAPVHFGLIPHDHWYQPDWIDEEKASAARDEMVRNQVIYGGMWMSRHTAHF